MWITVIYLMLGGTAWAKEKSQDRSMSEAWIDGLQWMNNSYEAVDKAIQDTARWLDLNLGSELQDDQHARTKLRAYNAYVYRGKRSAENAFKVKGKLVLPNLNRRVQLVFEGEGEGRDPERGDISGEEQRSAIRLIFDGAKKRKISLDTGIRGGLSRPKWFLRLRSHRSFKQDVWTYWLRPELVWDTKIGWSASFAADAERDLRDNWAIFTGVKPLWEDERPGMQFHYHLGFIKRIDPLRSVAFKWLNDFDTEVENHLDSSRLVGMYRRAVWRDVGFLEVGTGLVYDEETYYRGEQQHYVRFELIFDGKKS